MKLRTLLITLTLLFLIDSTALAQSVSEINSRAESYYESKQYARAIAEWIRALEIDPENTKIQQKIEMVYEKKRTRDLAFERSKKYLRIARQNLEKKEAQKSIDSSNKAVEYFVTAYRITPNDPDMQILRNRVESMRRKALLELERQKMHAQKRKEYEQHYLNAQALVGDKLYEQSLTEWEAMLTIFPEDNIAKEGKRKATLALQSRLRFEQIRTLTQNGIRLFNEKRYQQSLNEFEEVVKLDPGNPDAEDFIAKIDELLEEKDKYERKRVQAERYYQSSISNINENKYPEAREDLETVISLIEEYKDAKSRLASLAALEKEYLQRLKQQNLVKINTAFQSGLLYLSRAEYEDAISAFENILVIDSGNTQAIKYVKTAKEALAQEKKDIIDENSPYYNLVSTLISSGKLYYQKGDYDNSLRQWERILNLFPSNAQATEYLLKCQLKLNPDIYKKFAQEQIDEGKKFLQTKNYTRALRKFMIIKSISPDYPEIDSLITAAKPTKPQLPVALNGAPPKIIASSEQIEIRYNRGVQLYKQKQFKEALADFKWVVLNDPQHIRALVNVNRIESEIRLANRLENPLKSTLTADQKNQVRRYYFAGINYYSKNRFPEAIAEWRKVLAIDPNHAKAKNNIRKCLLLMKQ